MELSKLMGCVKRPFIPSELFRNGLIDGAWFDPSDLSTLYQDAAGTIPVTAVEQPVGLMLDKSQGMMLGPELVSNGTFDAGLTGWAGAAASVVNGELCVTATANYDAATQYSTIGALTVGKTYVLTATNARLGTSGGGFIRAGTGGWQATVNLSSTPKDVKIYFTATTTQLGVQLMQNSTTLGTSYADNISVRELYGYHATQSITASRPVLSARYNLLTKTEDFSDEKWTKNSVSVTTSQYLSPIGTFTANKVTLKSGAVTTGNDGVGAFASPLITANGSAYTLSLFAKSAGSNYIRFREAVDTGQRVKINLIDGSFVGEASWSPSTFTVTVTPAPNGFFLIQITRSAPTTFCFNIKGGDDVGDGINGFYVWGADLRISTSAGPYQRVNTATDYDTDERYFPKYLRFDGIDDYLTLGDVFDIGSEGVSIATSVILFDATKSPIAGKSRAGATGGRYFLGTEPSSFLFASHDSAPPVGIAYSQSIGESVVLSAKLGPHGNRSLSLYKNANLLSTVNTSLTTTSYDSTDPFWIGAYPNSTGTTPAYGYLNGGIYGLIITKSALTDAQRIACERHLSRKAGVAL